MSGYAKDRAWSDRFIPEIKGIVGPRLLCETPDEIDKTQAADLMVFTARNVTIAARVRRPGFLERYRYEFTIRARRDSGATTELAKIVDGWGDWMLYAHAAPCETRLAWWWLIDLNAFRAALIRQATNGSAIRCGDKPNGDGTFFKWFDVRSFPKAPPLVIACGGDDARAAA